MAALYYEYMNIVKSDISSTSLKKKQLSVKGVWAAKTFYNARKILWPDCAGSVLPRKLAMLWLIQRNVCFGAFSPL